MEKNRLVVHYANAFRCEACPGRGDEQGCPMWWAMVERNVAEEKERLTERCGLPYIAEILPMIIAASNRPAAAIESTREAIREGLADVAQTLRTRQVEEAGTKESLIARWQRKLLRGD